MVGVTKENASLVISFCMTVILCNSYESYSTKYCIILIGDYTTISSNW